MKRKTKQATLNAALDQLGAEFRTLPWEYNIVSKGTCQEIVRLWPGDPHDDIMVCVLKDMEFQERFHRQDYYFLNYAYAHDYQTVSDRRNNVVTVHEGECYIGQPFCGYALRQAGDDRAVVIGVLIQKELFYRDFLPILGAAPSIFDFFLEPRSNAYATDYLRLPAATCPVIRTLLELMVIEYANRTDETQAMLKSLTAALLLHIARLCRKLAPQKKSLTISEQIVSYMSEHMDTATLSSIGAHFSYHPTYVSNLLKKETGRTFTDLLRELRMTRATALLAGTTLSIEDIAAMLGYTNSSNFYKAFRETYGVTPREWLAQNT